MRLLYVVYWGALEPLGQALVVPPVLHLARSGVAVTLVTFEKGRDLADSRRVAACRAELEAAGARWLPLRYHRSPTLAATAWDLAAGTARAILAGFRGRPAVVHGRTFVGGLVGRLVAGALRRPFVYHAEGFWPEEQVAGGVWSRGGRAFRTATAVEGGLFRGAAGVVVLSRSARERVLALRHGAPESSVVVVPSCVDLDRFRPPAVVPPEPRPLVYSGSLGGRYPADLPAAFLAAALREDPAVSLRVYTQSDPALAQEALGALPRSAWSVRRLPHAEVPAALGECGAGLHLLAPGQYYGSPTRIGEYWACGIPVVTTGDVGDVDEIVRRERVGVILSDTRPEALTAAVRELAALTRDPALAGRCRAAAERHYSLERGVATQVGLYEALAKGRWEACATTASP